MCPSSNGIEYVEYFLLHYSSFLSLRRNLLARTFTLIRPFSFANLPNESLTKLLLYVDIDLPLHINREILQLTLQFIHDTGRFD